MYIYIYTHVYTYMYIHTCIYIYIYIYTYSLGLPRSIRLPDDTGNSRCAGESTAPQDIPTVLGKCQECSGIPNIRGSIPIYDVSMGGPLVITPIKKT